MLEGSSSSLLLTPVHDKHCKRLVDYVCLSRVFILACVFFAVAGVPGCPGSSHGAGRV